MHAAFVAAGPSESIPVRFDEIIPVQCNPNGQESGPALKVFPLILLTG